MQLIILFEKNKIADFEHCHSENNADWKKRKFNSFQDQEWKTEYKMLF